MMQQTKLLQCICRNKTFPRLLRSMSSTETNTTEAVNPNLIDQETLANSVTDNEDLVQVERYGDLTIIGLNRTQKRNAINQQMSLKICEAITNFENDSSSTVGVIHGVGSFSSGYDIDDLQSDTLKLENLMNSEGSVVSCVSFNVENISMNEILF